MFAIMKGSSEHIVGECWDILVSWGWKFLLAVMGVGVEVPIGRHGSGGGSSYWPSWDWGSLGGAVLRISSGGIVLRVSLPLPSACCDG